MKTFIFALMAALISFSALSVHSDVSGFKKAKVDTSIKLDSADLAKIQQGVPIQINLPMTDQDPTPTELVRYILSILGGLLTAIILKLLHHWWPKLFPSDNVKDYKE